MAGEDIYKIVETILSDKLSKIYDRLNNIESQIQKITEDIVRSTQSQTPGQKYDQTQQEFYFQVLNDEVQKLKMQISEVQTKTDRKLIESEKIRLSQENSLKNLSKHLIIQQEIRAIQQNLQNIVQISQFDEIQPNTQTINQQQPEQIVQRQVENDKQVYRTVSGKKYHQNGCEWLKSSQIAITLTEARQLGLGACFVCKP